MPNPMPTHRPELNLAEFDPEIARLIELERQLETDKIRLIPSENYVSRAVLEATGSILTNKYSEGYSGRRYYEGQQAIDPIEQLAVDRLKQLFGADHCNVQPYSGSPANLAVYLAFCSPGDPVLGLGLPAGGHLTHGWNVSITGRYFKSRGYGVRREDHRIDFDEVRQLAQEIRPKIIWCGTTAYPRRLDFDKFREIADEVGAKLCADISHIAGLIVAGLHPSPVGLADVVTSTTHKTLRGPRGGFILCKTEYADVIDRAVFPGLQGGPHNHTTAAIAVAARQASQPEFVEYARAVVDNAQVLADELTRLGFALVTGGTDNHLILIDLTNKNLTGKAAAKALDHAGMVANYNSVPFDPRKPFDPSGLRIGTPAITSRGMGPTEMKKLAAWMDTVLRHLDDEQTILRVAREIRELCRAFPAPGLSR
jgi:glycine hydroxymethyltransferase